MGLFTLFFAGTVVAEQKIEDAQGSLKQLEKKIVAIKAQINSKKQSHAQITKIILQKDLEINQASREKLNLQKKVNLLQIEIDKIKDNMEQSKLLTKQGRKKLYNHLNLHLRVANQNYLQVLLRSQNPLEYYQYTYLYQYLYHAEQSSLEKLKQQQEHLDKNKYNLAIDIQDLQKLKSKIEAKEIVIKAERSKRTQELNKIKQELNQKNIELVSSEKNQTQLKALLNKLLKDNQLQSARPFTVMKTKLNYPVDIQQPVITRLTHGIIFNTQENLPVHAVGAGKVVFSNWLNGYGFLIIVDHGRGFMSLYGNNNKLLKQTGVFVKQGDIIASAGKSGAFNHSGLYFELRQRSQAISAIDWFNKHA